jgi:hypothetical protein
MTEPTSASADRKRCPSSRCEPGNLLLGIVQANGEVDFFRDRIEVSAAFVAAARQGRRPESRFRFSSPCYRTGCSKWSGGGCGVAAQAALLASREAIAGDPRELPDCSIRDECQWFAERGPPVCKTCRWVVTERTDP